MLFINLKGRLKLDQFKIENVARLSNLINWQELSFHQL